MLKGYNHTIYVLSINFYRIKNPARCRDTMMKGFRVTPPLSRDAIHAASLGMSTSQCHVAEVVLSNHCITALQVPTLPSKTLRFEMSSVSGPSTTAGRSLADNKTNIRQSNELIIRALFLEGKTIDGEHRDSSHHLNKGSKYHCARYNRWRFISSNATPNEFIKESRSRSV